MRPSMSIARLALFAMLAACAGQAVACGPSAPITAEEMLDFQLGIVDRGLKRETLTDAQRAEIARLRAEVEAAQKADQRTQARAAMQKIVAMFTHKEMMGAVEPIVPGCAVPRAPTVTGTLTDIAIEPNRPGARCGNHYVLSIKEGGPSGKVVKLTLYDLAKAPYGKLEAMLRKAVEVDTLGSSVTGIRLAGAKPDAVASLAGLSTVKPC